MGPEGSIMWPVGGIPVPEGGVSIFTLLYRRADIAYFHLIKSIYKIKAQIDLSVAKCGLLKAYFTISVRQN